MGNTSLLKVGSFDLEVLAAIISEMPLRVSMSKRMTNVLLVQEPKQTQ
jgi:hypothetical protein